MNKKFRKALKKSYDIPEPVRKREFLNRLDKPSKGIPPRIKFLFSVDIPRIMADSLALLIFIGSYSIYDNIYYTNRISIENASPPDTVEPTEYDLSSDEDNTNNESSASDKPTEAADTDSENSADQITVPEVHNAPYNPTPDTSDTPTDNKIPKTTKVPKITKATSPNINITSKTTARPNNPVVTQTVPQPPAVTTAPHYEGNVDVVTPRPPSDDDPGALITKPSINWDDNLNDPPSIIPCPTTATTVTTTTTTTTTTLPSARLPKNHQGNGTDAKNKTVKIHFDVYNKIKNRRIIS